MNLARTYRWSDHGTKRVNSSKIRAPVTTPSRRFWRSSQRRQLIQYRGGFQPRCTPVHGCALGDQFFEDKIDESFPSSRISKAPCPIMRVSVKNQMEAERINQIASTLSDLDKRRGSCEVSLTSRGGGKRNADGSRTPTILGLERTQARAGSRQGKEDARRDVTGCGDRLGVGAIR